jgi:hypothetical protein
MSWKRLLLIAAITSLAGTAAIAIAVLLLGDFDETEARILATTLGISVASLLALPGAILLEQGRDAALAWLTVGFACAAFVLFEITIWNAWDNETAWKLTGSAAAAAAASTQISAMTTRLHATDRRAVRGAYVAAVWLAAILAGMVVLAVWTEIDSTTYYRALGALVVLNVFLSLVQPLLRRLREEPEEVHRIRIAAEPGGERDVELAGRDFAGALAEEVRRLERAGRRVTRIERL